MLLFIRQSHLYLNFRQYYIVSSNKININNLVYKILFPKVETLDKFIK
jgi:hypothetical protein